MDKRMGRAGHYGRSRKARLTAMVVVGTLGGCSVPQIQQQNQAISSAATAALKNAPQSRPVARVHNGAWLMGEKVPASKPQPEIFEKQVVFNASKPMRLQEIATWLANEVGVPVDVEASAYAPLPAQSTAPSSASASPASPATGPAGPLPSSGPFPVTAPAGGLPSGLATSLAARQLVWLPLLRSRPPCSGTAASCVAFSMW